MNLPPKSANLFLRYFHTVRFLKFKQIYGRIWFLLKRTMLKPIIIWSVNNADPILDIPKFNFIPKPFNEALLKCDPGNRKFVFLNRELTFQNRINWNDRRMEKLWLYNLHYFEYLLPLAKEHSEHNFLIGKSIITEWIEHNPTGWGNGWESYPLSLRIVNWIFFYDAYYSFFKKDKNFNVLFLTNLNQQVRYLRFFVEIHLLANHFFENIKALLFASIFFRNKALFKKTGVLLQKEVIEQILEDGGHFERSPMYHSIILADILDILNILKDRHSIHDSPVQPSEIALDQTLLEITAGKMLRWLEYMIHTDEQIAIFGDSALGIAPSFDQLKGYFAKVKQTILQPSNVPTSQPLRQSGYFIFRGHSQYFVIDGGDLGVRYQPGHVHCDLFSYEYSVEGKRFIVDSGVGNYHNEELSNQARSVYSHNTVVVNGVEQAEFWKIHRVGRWVELLTSKFEVKGNNIFFSGEYKNAIDTNRAYQHCRSVQFINTRFFRIQDRIMGKIIHSIESLIHFHPDCKIEQKADSIKLTIKDKSIWILWDNETILSEIREWFYIPEFGKIISSKELVLRPRSTNTLGLNYIITPSCNIQQAKTYF